MPDTQGEPRRGSVHPAVPRHLVPALLVLAAVVVAWRRPWVGALVLLRLAAACAAMKVWAPHRWRMQAL
jgi:hypothetical protein